ncbi:MAG: SAM-dependent methyltransferase, partial [Alphaproteobacteria bacterium]
MGKVRAAKSGARFEKITLRTARGRTTSSQKWLTRQLNDPYVHQAHLMGYRSRAAFKLRELDDAWHFLKPGQRVVDLGAAPGGWSQVAVERIHASPEKNLLVGIDLL